MTFEDPIDDIKEAIDLNTDYRLYQFDFQSITRAKAQSLLDLVHNGTLQYDGTGKHVTVDSEGTLTFENLVYFKVYPVTADVCHI